MRTAPNLSGFPWLIHGFGQRDSVYPPGIASLRQTHSSIVLEASQPGIDRFADGDALITHQPGLLVGVRTADCVPILIADVRTHAVAAVHAGWRGTAGLIVQAAVLELITRYDARAEDLHAAIGPAIGPCCYEVGPDVASRFGTSESHLDLAEVNETQLLGLGVSDIWSARECTFCEADRYYSFRREKEAAGRMMSFIGTI